MVNVRGVPPYLQHKSKPSLGSVFIESMAARLLKGLLLFHFSCVVVNVLSALFSFAVVVYAWLDPGIGCTLQQFLILPRRRFL